MAFCRRVMSRLLLLWCMLVHLAWSDETSKSIKDPVVRHDAKQCGQYLCPAFPNAAEEYITNGCNGDFTAASTTLLAAGLDTDGLNTKTLTSLASAAALVAVILGFVAGAHRTSSRRQGYLPVNNKADADF